MKWIGQHIYDLVARFRDDVYLEGISTGTIASGAHLGLDSNNKIVKAADGGGDLTSIVAGTGLSGTSLTGPIPTLNVDAAQTQITSIGTIATGVWNGTTVASAYLDADTAHLSGSQTFTGTKTLNSFKGTGGATVTNILDEDAMGSDSATALATQQSIKAYVDTRLYYIHTAYKAQTGMDTERYVSLVDADRENTSEDSIAIVAVMPANGVLKKVIWNTSSDLTGKSWTFRFKKIPSGTGYTSETLVATVTKQATSGMEGANTNSIIDFTTDDSDADNACTYASGSTAPFSAGDRVLFSVQADSAPSGQPKINLTLVFEIDYTTVL